MNHLRTAAHKAPIFLGLGSVLATGAAAPGCRSDDTPATEALQMSEKGVRTLVSEVTPGRYVIDEEVLVDTATHVVVRRLDGAVERITDPDAFAALLPPPDSVRTLVAVSPDSTGRALDTTRSPLSGGGGGSWDAGTPASDDQSGEQVHRSHGFPLGTLLFYSLAMNAWRPRAYSGIMTAPPRGIYRDDRVRQGSSSAGSGLLAAQRAGQAPTSLEDARSRSAVRTRAARPSGGRSGYGRTWGRSGG